MYVRECVGCGTEFQSSNFRQKKCRRGCGANTNRSRTVKRAHNEMAFVGVDGEGVTRPDGAHEYVMLSVGSDTLFKDGARLDTGAIFAFLWSSYIKHRDACFVGFFLGYDFNMWLKGLPEDVARLLLTNDGIAKRKPKRQTGNPVPDPVVWNGWEFDILAGRRFKLRPHIHKVSMFSDRCRNLTCQAEVDTVPDGEPEYIVPGEMEFDVSTVGEGIEVASIVWSRYLPPKRQNADGTQKRGWFIVCDTGAFWQASFLKVIDPKGWDRPVCTMAEYKTIVKGKSGRDIVAEYGDISYYAEMVKYNILENDILGRVTQRLNEGFMNPHIPIKIPKADWYGPGRAAQIWMDMLSDKIADPFAVESNKLASKMGLSGEPRMNEGGLKNVDVYLSMPEWFYNAAKNSYYGGWFEIFAHGHVGTAHEYDINSAYPAIIATLPCLHTHDHHTGKYRQCTPTDATSLPVVGDNEYAIVFCTLTGSDPYVGAMPLRSKKGTISRPRAVKGWYWHHEITAAMRAGLIDSVEVHEYVVYTACKCPPPFNPADIGIERMYTLRLEVGKNTPQGKGFKLVYNSAYGKTAQSIGNPKYSNPVYASLITAGCRTMILDAIATHPKKTEALLMVATDGVYFSEPHPTLDLSPAELGKWDYTLKEDLTLLMPGVYWDKTTREAVQNGGSPKLKSRGINARDLANEIESLDEMFLAQEIRLRTSGIYEWPIITFKVGFLMDSAKLALQRGKWDTAGKVHRESERKIDSNPRTKREPIPYWDHTTGLVRTHPYAQGENLETVYYPETFGMIDPDERSLFPGQITRDLDAGWDWRALVSGDI